MSCSLFFSHIWFIYPDFGIHTGMLIQFWLGSKLDCHLNVYCCSTKVSPRYISVVVLYLQGRFSEEDWAQLEEAASYAQVIKVKVDVWYCDRASRVLASGLSKNSLLQNVELQSVPKELVESVRRTLCTDTSTLTVRAWNPPFLEVACIVLTCSVLLRTWWIITINIFSVCLTQAFSLAHSALSVHPHKLTKPDNTTRIFTYHYTPCVQIFHVQCKFLWMPLPGLHAWTEFQYELWSSMNQIIPNLLLSELKAFNIEDSCNDKECMSLFSMYLHPCHIHIKGFLVYIFTLQMAADFQKHAKYAPWNSYVIYVVW